MNDSTLVATWPFAAEPARRVLEGLEDGSSALEAVLEVCRRVDDDPTVDSVGWGGNPDRSGRVSLDGAVMLGPDRLGAVACLREHAHPADLARLVMERTPHALLVGEDADTFADSLGWARTDLLAPEARARFEAWCQQREAQVEPHRFGARGHDTVCALALDANGVLAGATSTSGAAWKLPGRVGDSPVFGAGLYVEPGVGAAAATGLGERVLGRCSTFLVVEELRRGATPDAALEAALARYPSPSIASERGAGPAGGAEGDQVALIVLDVRGRWAAAALRPGFSAVVATRGATRVVEVAARSECT